MTHKEFMAKHPGLSYSMDKNGWLVIKILSGSRPGPDDIYEIPERVIFDENRSRRMPDHVYLDGLISIPDNVTFSNKGVLSLKSCKSIGNNVKFLNRGPLILRTLNIGGRLPLYDMDECLGITDRRIEFGLFGSSHLSRSYFDENLWKPIRPVKMYESWLVSMN